jgi:hypothetical protein
MRKPSHYYLRNISRRWHTEIKKVDNGKVIILSPYLTSETAEAILRGSKFAECEIYTIFSVQNFVSGASSLKTLKCLYERGCKLYHLPRLHAKIVMSPGRFATIGSQNLTRNGVKNKEASVIIFDKEEVEKIEQLIERWISDRKSITAEMLKELDQHIKTLRKKFSLINRELKKEINDLEIDLWKNEEERRLEELAQLEEEARLEEARLEEARLEEQRRLKEEREEKERKEVINAARARVQQLSAHGKIELELAKEFIKQSAYWYDHPCGSPVRAARHANNIYESYPNNWVINFGSNSFLVGAAIYRCQQALLEFLEKAECKDVMPIPQLREKLGLIVQGAVSNHEGEEYNGYYSAMRGNFMKFGSQAINIYDFVNLIFSQGGIDDRLVSLI